MTFQDVVCYLCVGCCDRPQIGHEDPLAVLQTAPPVKTQKTAMRWFPLTTHLSNSATANVFVFLVL